MLKGISSLIVVLLVIIISGIGIGGYIFFEQLPTTTTTPKEVGEIWWKSIFSGDWNELFMNTVNINSNPLSDDCQNKIKIAYAEIVGGTYSLKIEDDIIPCKDVKNSPLPIPSSECIALQYSLNTNTKFGSSTGYLFFVKVEDEWKVQIDCKWYTGWSTTTTVMVTTSSTITSTLPLITTTLPVTTSTTTVTTSTTTVTTMPTTTTISQFSGGLDLTIYVPKTSVTVGETFQGSYNVEYKGNPVNFQAYSIETCGKQGHVEKCSSYGTIGWKSSHSLLPCNINETLPFNRTCNLNSFQQPGTYIFDLMVYNCTQIEQTLGVTCGNANYTDVMSQVSPLNSTEKTVIVTG